MERAQLASAFHRIARSVRQTAAMKGRLERDALDIARRREAKAAEIAKAPLTARKAQVCARIGNLAYAEIDDDAEFHQLELDAVERLEREALFEGFLDEPLEAQVDRIARALGLTPPADPPPRTEGSPSPLAGEGAPRLPDG